MTRTIIWLSILTIPIVLLIAGSLVESPSAVAQGNPHLLHHGHDHVGVLKLQKTLDGVGGGAGDDVTWTLTAQTNVIVLGIFRDNTPTIGQCVLQAPFQHGAESPEIDCAESDYRLVNVKIAESQHKGGNELPKTKADNDHLTISNILKQSLSDVPLKRGETIVLTFDTQNGVNDVNLEVSFAFRGLATLT